MFYILLVVGFVLLIKGADFFVEGSSNVAKMLRVHPLIVGMTIVAMGTSLPECAVSVSAAIQGNNEMAVSNVVGSNIFNLMVVCGACALFKPLAVQVQTLKHEFPFCIITTLLLLIMGYQGKVLDRADGISLLVLFTLFLLWMIKSAKKESSNIDVIEKKPIPIWKCILFIVGGALAIAGGGNLVVKSASAIASFFGLSQNLIGLTIVAMGTSLPELVTSIVAAKKGQVDMALGNVIGSNIFNVLFVLGTAATICPIGFIADNFADLLTLSLVSLVAWVFAWTGKHIQRGEGTTMLVMYATYTFCIIIR